LVERLQQLAGAREIGTPGVGQGDVAGGAVEQAGPEAVFEARQAEMPRRRAAWEKLRASATAVNPRISSMRSIAIISKLEIQWAKTQGLSTDDGAINSQRGGSSLPKTPEGRP
jgi:hypothetical protein